MPTPTPEPQPTPPPADVPAPPTSDPPEPREGKRYSDIVAKLSEREQRLAAAEARVEALHRREIERLASAALSESGDVWLDGVEVASMLTEAGDVDPDKVTAAVQAIVGKRPGTKRPQMPRPLPGGGQQVVPTGGPGISFGDALARRGLAQPSRGE